MPIPQTHSPALDLMIAMIGIILIFGGGIIAVMYHLVCRAQTRKAKPLPAPHTSPGGHWWLAGILTGLLLLVTLGWMDAHDEQARMADLAAARVSTADCPPPGPDLTDTVVMVITSQADRRPSVTGCSRIAERAYSIKKPIMANAK